MDKQLLTNIKRVVKTHCCNFSNGGECPLYRQCVYYRDDVPEQGCQWAIDAVIPNEPDVEATYLQSIGTTEDTKDIGVCESCGRSIVKNSNRQKYCTECKSKSDRQSKTDRQRKYRHRARKSKSWM